MRQTRTLILLLTLLLAAWGCGSDDGRRCYEEALLLMEQHDAPQALERLRQAADLADDDSLLAAIYTDMGALLFDEGLQEQALAAYTMAYDYSCARADTAAMAYSLFDMGNMYRTRDEDDSCLVCFDEAWRLAWQQGDSLMLMDIGSQLAGYHLEHGDYDEAERLLTPALHDTLMATMGGIRFMAADLYRHIGPADSAHHYCTLLLDEEETGLRKMGHKWMAELLLQEGRADEAVAHLEAYDALTDSLMEEIDTEALHRVEALYDYSLREQQNARLQRRITLAVGVSAVLLVALVAIVLQALRRREGYRMKVRQLELLLAERQAEGERSSQRQQQVMANTPICQRINRLLADSERRPMADEDWHILEDTMAKVQPSFMPRLGEFRRLTPHEMHVCLLLRIGLPPADIAQLTAHSKQSISSVRSRLFEKVFGRKGTPTQWDEFVRSL